MFRPFISMEVKPNAQLIQWTYVCVVLHRCKATDDAEHSAVFSPGSCVLMPYCAP